MLCRSQAHAVALLVDGGCIRQLVFLLALSMVVVSDFSLFFLSIFFAPFRLLFSSSFQSNVHYVSSDDFGAECKKMLEAGKTQLKLGEGEYRLEKGDLTAGSWGNRGAANNCHGYFVLDKPTKISGQGCGKTTLIGFGLGIRGKLSEGIVEIENLKIKGGEGCGLYAFGGMNVIMRGCSVEECQRNGVYAYTTRISCYDLQVFGCGYSGVWAGNTTTITLSGQGTSIQRNVTKGNSLHYGLALEDTSSNIQLVAPLIKEKISTNNGGGGNWGGGLNPYASVSDDGKYDGKIEQVHIDYFLKRHRLNS